MNDSEAASTEGGSLESGRSDGRGRAHFRSSASRSGRTGSADLRQGANGQRHPLGPAHGRAVARHAGRAMATGTRCSSASRAGASSGFGTRRSRRWRAWGLRSTRNTPCGRISMQPAYRGPSRNSRNWDAAAEFKRNHSSSDASLTAFRLLLRRRHGERYPQGRTSRAVAIVDIDDRYSGRATGQRGAQRSRAA